MAARAPARLIFAAETEQDLGEAYAWYESQRTGLGEDFLTCVDACIDGLCRVPQMHHKVHENYRRALVRRFPYAIFYEYVDGEVTIYSIFHTAQNPDKWRQRLP